MIEKLQYITEETSNISHIDCVREACIGGVKWVQLNVKNKSYKEYLTIAKEAKLICDLYDVILIISDDVNIAKEVNAHGVHLAKADMYISEARTILGEDAIIGATANTLNDIERLIEQKASYITLGPYSLIEKGKNSNTALGLAGYDEILNELKSYYSLNDIPIIATGGIDLYDVEPILRTGIFGVAVSELITNDFHVIQGLIKTIDRNVFKMEALHKNLDYGKK